MHLLTCFHDADKLSDNFNKNLNGILTQQADNLTASQRMLKRFHEKLGHLGFQHLKAILSTGTFGPLGIRCSQKDVLPPICESCLLGGQQKKPIDHNIRTQDPNKKGVLKTEQLEPGQRVFSDQYVSSKEGRNFTG